MLIQFFEVSQTLGESGEFGLFRPGRIADGFAEGLPFLFSLDSDGDPFIIPGALVVVMGRHSGTEIYPCIPPPGRS